MRADVPVCRLEDGLDEVRRRVREAGWDTCFVIDGDRVVLGRLGRAAITGTEPGITENAMTPGPSTIRPSARLRQTVERMRSQNLSSLPVTTSDGRLVGLLLREDAEAAPVSGPQP